MTELDLSYCTWSGYDRDGFLGIQADAYTEGNHGVTPFHALSPGGMDHRPVDPDGEKGALCLRWSDAHEGFLLVLNDVRTESALPNLSEGATRIFDSGSKDGHPFEFSVLLDPSTHALTVESHRVGGKITLKLQEGITLELSGTSLRVTGATSAELGGQEQLAKFAALSAALNSIGAALTGLSAASLDKAGTSVMATAATAAIGTFASAGATLITKGT